MARYDRSYTGEWRTEHVGFYVTPSEAAELDAGRLSRGGTRSEYARELLFRRTAAVIADVRRNPEAKALADELRAIGINLNQIARHANIGGEIADMIDELEDTLTAIKAATARVISL